MTTPLFSIPKVIVYTLICIMIYCLAIEIVRPQISLAQSQWVMNKIKVERFLYRDAPAQAVMVGSSLAGLLPDQILGDDIVNIAFAGGSALTGLEVIKRSQQLPKRVIIEINYLDRPIDQPFVDELFHAVLHRIRKSVRALRTTYQPINVALSFINNLRNPDGMTHRNTVNPVVHKNEVDRKFESNQSFGSKEQFLSHLAGLKADVRWFNDQDVEVIMLSMPIDKVLVYTQRHRFITQRLQEEFPSSQFQWINHLSLKDLKTMDGIHLIDRDARRIAEIIKEQVLSM